MIYQFRALSDENDHFARDYQLMYNATLHDFHDHICADLKFDPESMASFFLSDRGWDKLREFTLQEMGDMGGDFGDMTPLTMAGVTLHEIIENNGDRLIYTFDFFGDRSLYMEMTGVYKSDEGVNYPCTILSNGHAPDQFDADATITDNDSIFDDAMDEFGEFEGDDNYDDN
jgi:hypothetical protein